MQMCQQMATREGVSLYTHVIASHEVQTIVDYTGDQHFGLSEKWGQT